MRTFLAADIDKDVNDRIMEFMDIWSVMDKGVKWSKAGTNHITIYFFGEVAPDDIDVLTGAVSYALKQIKPFNVSASGISAFPSMKRPRVFWIGIENGTNELEKIYESIKKDLPEKKIKVNIETKDYTPHLTIGRVKGRCDPETIQKLSAESERKFGSFIIDKITLYQSILRREGPLYKPLKVFQI
jgi:2'-5' RNA ligase